MVLNIGNELFENDIPSEGNFATCPGQIRMNDFEVIALTVVSESVFIDNENWLLNSIFRQLSHSIGKPKREKQAEQNSRYFDHKSSLSIDLISRYFSLNKGIHLLSTNG